MFTPYAIRTLVALGALGATFAGYTLFAAGTVYSLNSLFSLRAAFTRNALFALGTLLAFRTAWSLDAADFRVLAAVPDVAQAVRLHDIEVAFVTGGR